MVLDLAARSQKRSQIQVLGPRIGPSFRSLALERPQSQVHVLEKALGLGPKSQKASQIQVIVPSKDPRFRSQVLKKDVDLGPKSYKRSQIQVLGLDLRPRSYILSKILVLGPRFSFQVPRKRSMILVLCPRNVLDCGSGFQERSQIQVLRLGKGPRLLPFVLERFLDL